MIYIGLPTFLLLFLLCVQSSKSCHEGSILTEPPLNLSIRLHFASYFDKIYRANDSLGNVCPPTLMHFLALGTIQPNASLIIEACRLLHSLAIAPLKPRSVRGC